MEPCASEESVREERDSLRVRVRCQDREIRKLQKQLHAYAQAAQDLYKTIEEQQDCVTNNLLRQREVLRKERLKASPSNIAHTPTQAPQSHLLRVTSSGSAGECTSPLDGSQTLPHWEEMYHESERRCQELESALHRMHNEVFMHRQKSDKMKESFTNLQQKHNEAVAKAEVRAENTIDREIHKTSRIRSWSISSTSSVSDFEGRDIHIMPINTVLRAHTQAVLSTATPPLGTIPSIPPSPSIRSQQTTPRVSNQPVHPFPSLFEKMRSESVKE